MHARDDLADEPVAHQALDGGSGAGAEAEGAKILQEVDLRAEAPVLVEVQEDRLQVAQRRAVGEVAHGESVGHLCDVPGRIGDARQQIVGGAGQVAPRRNLPHGPCGSDLEERSQLDARGIGADVLIAQQRERRRVDGAPSRAIQEQRDLEALRRHHQQIVHVVGNVVQCQEDRGGRHVHLAAAGPEAAAEEAEVAVVDGPVSVQVGGGLEPRIRAGGAVGGLEPRLVFSVYIPVAGEIPRQRGRMPPRGR